MRNVTNNNNDGKNEMFSFQSDVFVIGRGGCGDGEVEHPTRVNSCHLIGKHFSSGGRDGD